MAPKSAQRAATFRAPHTTTQSNHGHRRRGDGPAADVAKVHKKGRKRSQGRRHEKRILFLLLFNCSGPVTPGDGRESKSDDDERPLSLIAYRISTHGHAVCRVCGRPPASAVCSSCSSSLLLDLGALDFFPCSSCSRHPQKTMFVHNHQKRRPGLQPINTIESEAPQRK